MGDQHVGHQPSDAPAADNQRAFPLALIRQAVNRSCLIHPARQPATEDRQQGCDSQAQCGDDLPELRRIGPDQVHRNGAGQDDQGGFGRAGQENSGLGRRSRAIAVETQQQAGHQRLGGQDQHGRQHDLAQPRHDQPQVQAHPHGQQEDPQGQPLERFDDRFDFGVIVRLGNQQARHQRADDGREANRAGRQGGNDHDEQAGGQEHFRTFGPCRLGKQPGQGKPANAEQRDDHQRAHAQGMQEIAQVGALLPPAHGTKQEDDRHQRDILEQQGAQRRASDRRGRIGNAQDQRGGGQGQRHAQRQGGWHRIA